MTKGKGRNPGAGGLDKHIKRTAHKERSQPEARKHLGALEKHKDYVKRSKRRHEKVTKIKQLKRAAAQRNPDEFNIKMTQSVLDMASGKVKRKQLKKVEKDKEARVALRQNQANVNYLRHAAEQDERRAREILGDVVGLDLKPCNTHTVFVDDEDEVKRFKPAKYFNTTNEMLAHPATRGNVDIMSSMVLPQSLAARADVILTKAQKLRSQEAQGPKSDTPASGDDAEVQASSAPIHETAMDMDDIVAAQKLANRAERLKAASKMKEVTERFKRSKGLKQLAGEVKRQSSGIQKNLNQRKTNRLRRGVVARSR